MRSVDRHICPWVKTKSLTHDEEVALGAQMRNLREDQKAQLEEGREGKTGRCYPAVCNDHWLFPASSVRQDYSERQ